MTVTATAVPTLLADVPAGVTIITQQQIQQRGYTTLVQALAAVPGLGVVQSGGPGGQASVFIRGTASNDVLVLLNGAPINDPSQANGAFNFGDYTLSDIERIEVVRGPMSGLYGSNAIGGVINIITLQGSGKPKLSVEAAGGFPAQGQASAILSGKSGKFDYAIGGAIDEEAGFDYNARRLTAYTGNRDPFRSKLGSLDAGYSPVNGTRISLTLRAQATSSGTPDSPNFDDPDDFLYNTNSFGKIGITSELFGGFWSTALFAARLENDLTNKNLLDAADPNASSANDHYHGYRTDVQWNNTLHLPDYGLTSFSSVLFGIEDIGDRAVENANDGSLYGPYMAQFHAGQHTLAGHAGLQTTFLQRLTFTAALRDDSVSSFGSAVTGRLGGVLAIPEADLHLKASYGTGFLAPSLFDLYGTSQSSFGFYRGNPDLKAEHSAGYEAGAQFDIPAWGAPDFLSLSATYFNNDLKDLIATVYDVNFNSTETNINKAQTHGVETELVFTPAPWFNADISYTLTDIHDPTGQTQLRRPQNTASATATILPIPQLSIVPQWQYVGRFSDFLYNNDGSSGGNASGLGYAKPGTIVNLSVNYAYSTALSLFATGDNLLQSRFEPVNGDQIPGQSFLFGVRAAVQ
jgi:vitamin B12 transporter